MTVADPPPQSVAGPRSEPSGSDYLPQPGAPGPHKDRQPVKRCTKCGIEKPRTEFNKHPKLKDGLRPSCRECDRRSQRARYARKGEEVRTKNRENYHRNVEAMRERVRRYVQENQAAMRAYQMRYHAANAERKNAYGREYRKQNPDLVKASRHARRVREVAAEGTFTAGEWRTLCDSYGRACLCCGKVEPEIKLSPDHVVPLSRGGSNDISNIQPLCLSCNNLKRANTIDFRPQGGK